ncbi:hypothetical protein [Ferruginibacter sp. HRS2-29]|uniref:hypothetical protein n=1 Tax=Ferruginibacter sp. HRS2-29 TaxID=2487334 RepID=UPI0020CDCDED|nr:hypothetical protein [Ferruginibacter sp. HRS2-29]MCP9750345.1 hypothetical protein [Ferruginibacter sp. HRS2-29]
MISYKEDISFEIEKDKAAIITALKLSAKNISVSGDDIEIRRHNSFLHLLAPTGKVGIHLSQADESHTRLDCTVRPSIFTFRSAAGFTILSVIVWSLVFWFFELNVYMAVFFVLHWIVMCFVALYILVVVMALLTVMLLIYNLNDFPLQYVIVAWIVTLLITHLTMRYNRSTLRQYLTAIVHSIKAT